MTSLPPVTPEIRAALRRYLIATEDAFAQCWMDGRCDIAEVLGDSITQMPELLDLDDAVSAGGGTS